MLLLAVVASISCLAPACQSSDTGAIPNYSSSSAASQPAATSQPETVGKQAFCKTLADFSSNYVVALTQRHLSTAQAAFGQLASTANDLQVHPYGQPPADLGGMVSDLRTIVTWLNTAATQDDVANQSFPAVVSAAFADLKARGVLILEYQGQVCPGSGAFYSVPTT